MRLLQINSTINDGSTGRIAYQIGEMCIANGDESYIAFSGRYFENNNMVNTIRIGSKLDFYWHALVTRIFDRHGFGSIRATKKLLKQIDYIKPDIVHLHNLHGYYINIEILFNYLASTNIPIVWTLHDCWSFTGHCDHFEYIDCNKWQKSCHTCPQKSLYPASLIVDNSKENFVNKRRLFNSVNNLTIVPVSNWLNSKLKYSFLKNYSSRVIHNGIDLEVFRPRDHEFFVRNFHQQKKFILLGVASIWSKKKGFYEFIKLSRCLDENFVIVLVGVSPKLKKKLPKNIISIAKTSNQQELAKLYSSSDIYLNLTFEDTYPTTNLESIACGTPVITYKTGGSPESVEEGCGIIVNQGDIDSLVQKIKEIKNNGLPKISQESLRLIASDKFDKDINFVHYLNLYKSILGT
jgi:putative colanic acid biosynthesis glycosyltransferase